MKLILGEDIAWELLEADRTCAIIIYGGKIYEDDSNHQSCLQNIFTDLNFDLNNENEMAKAIEITDRAFREGRLHGFDVFEHENNRYLVSHYPQTLENESIFRLVFEYAKKHKLHLATFTDRNELGNECRLVQNTGLKNNV